MGLEIGKILLEVSQKTLPSLRLISKIILDNGIRCFANDIAKDIRHRQIYL